MLNWLLKKLIKLKGVDIYLFLAFWVPFWVISCPYMHPLQIERRLSVDGEKYGHLTLRFENHEPKKIQGKSIPEMKLGLVWEMEDASVGPVVVLCEW